MLASLNLRWGWGEDGVSVTWRSHPACWPHRGEGALQSQRWLAGPTRVIQGVPPGQRVQEDSSRHWTMRPLLVSIWAGQPSFVPGSLQGTKEPCQGRPQRQEEEREVSVRPRWLHWAQGAGLCDSGQGCLPGEARHQGENRVGGEPERVTLARAPPGHGLLGGCLTVDSFSRQLVVVFHKQCRAPIMTGQNVWCSLFPTP